MKKIIIMSIALIIAMCVIGAGCTNNTNNQPIQIEEPEEYHEILTNDNIVGKYVSVDDMQGQITNMAGNKMYLQIFPDYTYKEHWFTYVDGLEYLSTTEGTWEPITTKESKIVKVTKPASLGDENIYVEVDKADYDYQLNYKWATEPFIHLFKIDTNHSNMIINHDGKQFRKLKDEDEIPPLK